MIEIKIACEGTLIPLAELKVIQGNLKTLTKESFADLTAAIENDGWSFPISYWVNDAGEKCILDGTQRHRVATKNIADGKWVLPAVPTNEVKAPDFQAAVLKLLHGASSYGDPDGQGYYELATLAELKVEKLKEVKLAGIDKKKHAKEYYDTTPQETPPPSQTIRNAICPNCQHIFEIVD